VEYLEAISTGKHDVEDDEFKVSREDYLAGLVAVSHGRDPVAIELESVAEGFAQCQVILDQE
jgi:hypothetical protein